MKFLSICSGIEAASVAWEPLGWQAVGFAEIEPFPAAVLKHHYPTVINYGDMTELPDSIRLGLVDLPDILCGGTPCQAFSVAGLRESLDDARGNLTLVFCEIANAIDEERTAAGQQPCVVFWENVPGVLSTKDNAFGCFLGELAGENLPLDPPGGKWANAGAVLGPKRAVAWRTLDAQYFGVAQRRRRVFVVASARTDFDPTSVLFEFDGVRRDSPPSRETGKAIAPTIAGCANGGGANGPGRDVDSVESLQVIMSSGQANAEIRTDGGAPALTCLHEAPIAAYPVAHAFDARQSDVIQYGNKTGPLDTDGHSVAVAVALRGREGGATAELGDEVGNCLRASGGGGDKAHVLAPAVRDISQTLTSNYGKQVDSSDTGLGPNVVFPAMQVRRLTPRECERLQGFPDDYTDIKPKGKPTPDGPRYKALGNSWAVPCVRWIGARIEQEMRGVALGDARA